jgi:hypothetical protein
LAHSSLKERVRSRHEHDKQLLKEAVMKLQEVKRIAKNMGLDAAKLTKDDLIRTIQVKEGNVPCFGVGKAAECGQAVCLWREDCN